MTNYELNFSLLSVLNPKLTRQEIEEMLKEKEKLGEEFERCRMELGIPKRLGLGGDRYV